MPEGFVEEFYRRLVDREREWMAVENQIASLKSDIDLSPNAQKWLNFLLNKRREIRDEGLTDRALIEAGLFGEGDA